MIKENSVAIAGYVGGVWNKETNGFEVKSGISKNDVKWQQFVIKVSKKEGEAWVNGKDIPVMLFGDVDVVLNSMLGVYGSFEPNNYVDKDGVEVRGFTLTANVGDMFVPENKFKPTAEVKGSDVPF